MRRSSFGAAGVSRVLGLTCTWKSVRPQIEHFAPPRYRIMRRSCSRPRCGATGCATPRAGARSVLTYVLKLLGEMPSASPWWFGTAERSEAVSPEGLGTGKFPELSSGQPTAWCTPTIGPRSRPHRGDGSWPPVSGTHGGCGRPTSGCASLTADRGSAGRGDGRLPCWRVVRWAVEVVAGLVHTGVAPEPLKPPAQRSGRPSPCQGWRPHRCTGRVCRQSRHRR